MDNENKDDVVFLHLDDIIPNRFQPREVFDERALKELAVSIKEHGVIQPIIVRSVNGKYEIIAGERRYKASALAGLTKIPAIIRDLDDKESSKVALLENLQRKNLNAIEEARTYQKILELDEMTQDELAKTMGKSQSAVANKVRLLTLPEEIQEAVLKEQISERHARALLQVPDADEQKQLMQQVIDERIPVRKLEKLIKEKYPKEKAVDEIVSEDEQKVNVPEVDQEASTTDFVNTNPLQPTTDVENDEDYGKVVVAPPEGEEQKEGTPKFINYGEIDDDEDSEIKPMDLPSATTTADVDEITSKAEDINDITKKDNEKKTDLDSILNIDSSNQPKPESEEKKFITPAEGIVKTDMENDKEDDEDNDDYFESPDLSDIDLPSEAQPEETENVSVNDLETPKEEKEEPNVTIPLEGKYTIQTAVEKIRQLAKDLNEHDLPTDIEEMNFNKSYQIIVKIEKTEEE